MDENRKFWPNQNPYRPNRPGVPKWVPSRAFSQPSISSIERKSVVDYLQNIKVDGMRKNLCHGCAFSTLYDKNNKAYKISRTTTLEEVKAIVEEIKKINNDGIGAT